MREIKFRGKKVGDGGWAYGFYWNHKPFSELRHYIRINGQESLQVHEDSVGQFTGLEDKNGKPIYEGDIVHIDSRGHSWHVVYGYFGDAKFYVCNGINSGREIEDENNIWVARITKDEVFELEVIGNIHDNKNKDEK